MSDRKQNILDPPKQYKFKLPIVLFIKSGSTASRGPMTFRERIIGTSIVKPLFKSIKRNSRKYLFKYNLSTGWFYWNPESMFEINVKGEIVRKPESKIENDFIYSDHYRRYLSFGIGRGGHNIKEFRKSFTEYLNGIGIPISDTKNVIDGAFWFANFRD